MSAYSFYFTEFYMKYVPVSNVYHLAIMMGISDMLTALSYSLLSKHLVTKSIIFTCSFLLTLSSLILTVALYLSDPNASSGHAHSMQVLYSMTVFGMRFFSALTFMSAYQANNDYFPTLLKGAIFAVTNIVSRLSSVFSPVIAEYMSNPAITVVIIGAVTSLCSTRLSKE
jgi:hypothetical protein